MEYFLAPIIILIALVVVFIISVFKASKFDCKCTVCKKQFTPKPLSMAIAPQSKGYKYVYCPHCRAKQFSQLIYKGK